MARKNMALTVSIGFALLAFGLLIVAGNDWLHTPPWVDVMAVFASPLALMASLAWLIRWDDLLDKPDTHAKTNAKHAHAVKASRVVWYEFHD